MRFVDVDALKKNIECVRTSIVFARGNGKGFLRECFMDYRNAVLKCVDAAPTIDAVPVVRCKDCVWCEQGKSYEPYCNHPTDGMCDVQRDDFCSYGERRSEMYSYTSSQLVDMFKRRYPAGTRIELDFMGDDPHPIAPGTRGTVRVVDDMGTVHCDFDNGRRLGLIPGEDSFHIVKEVGE